MEDRADAFVVLPGGVGTLDELLRRMDTGYLGLHDKPIVLLDPFGHYEGLWTWLCGLLTAVTSPRPRWTGWCWSTNRAWACAPASGAFADLIGCGWTWKESRVTCPIMTGGAAHGGQTDRHRVRAPACLADMPVIVRGALTGLLAQPSSKKSIGTVFQERAARYGDRVFLRFGDQQLTYRDANAAANRYAAVLAARGVGQGDVVGIMLRNSPNAVLAMLAAVKCGAVAGMLNYHQRGEVLAHSLGLLDAKVLIAETDLVSAVAECGGSGTTETLTVEDLERFA